jgi:hypothetical protein
MVAVGSVVLCGSVLPDADACGVAFRVASALQSALQLDLPPLNGTTSRENREVLMVWGV